MYQWDDTIFPSLGKPLNTDVCVFVYISTHIHIYIHTQVHMYMCVYISKCIE